MPRARGRYSHRRLDLPDRADRRRRAAHAKRTRARALADRDRGGRAGAAARRAAPRSAARPSARRSSSTISKHLNKVHRVRRGSAQRRRSQPGVVLDQLNAHLQAARLWFPVDVRPARRRRSAAWPATTPAARARSATATWCTTCCAIDAVARRRRRARASARCRGPARPTAPRLSRARREAARASPSAKREEIEHAFRRCCGGSAATTSTCLGPPQRTTLGASARRLAKARSRYFERIHLKLSPLPQHKTLGVCHFPTLLQGDGSAAAHRQARARRGRAGRPHDDRARARQPGVSRRSSSSSSAASPRRSCWSSSPATTATSSCAKLQAARRADGRSRPAGQRRRDHRRARCSATSGKCARRGSTS